MQIFKLACIEQKNETFASESALILDQYARLPVQIVNVCEDGASATDLRDEPLRFKENKISAIMKWTSCIDSV